MSTKAHRWLGFGFLFAILLSVLTACGGKKSILVGFSAELTGRNAALGVDGRDGAILAIETLNAAGGVGGHSIELIVQDDLATAEGALAADTALIDAGVVAIIGHLTSGTMVAVWPSVKDSGTVYLSPTVSTPTMSGKKDNFFRLIPANSYTSKNLASYAFKELGLRRVVAFYDTNNLDFTQTYRNGFGSFFQEHGGEIIADYPFSSPDEPDFKPFLQEAKAQNVDGILMVASAVDTALLAQQANLIGLNVQILTSNWAFTQDIIQNGGEAVDGMLTVVSHDENNQSPTYLAFKKKFIEQYGRQPTFAAGYGYEAIMVLAAALEKTDGTRNGLAEALLETKNFPGTHGFVSLDAYGDVQRTLYLLTIENGQMKTIHAIETTLDQ